MRSRTSAAWLHWNRQFTEMFLSLSNRDHKRKKIRIYLFKLYTFIAVKSTENTLCSDCLGIENLDKDLKLNCFELNVGVHLRR